MGILIECSKCKEWEDMPNDTPRHKSQSFIWIRNLKDEAMYKCTECKSLVISKTTEDEE